MKKKDKKVIVLNKEIEMKDLPLILREEVIEILKDKKKSADEKKSNLKDAYDIVFTYDLRLRLREKSSATILKEAA